MYTVSDLRNGLEFMHEGVPYEAVEVQHKHIGRGGSVTTVRMKNLLTGIMLTQNFRASDRFEEVELGAPSLKYLYTHRDAYWFCKTDNPGERFQLTHETLGDAVHYLKPNMVVDAVEFRGTIVNIKLPIKMDFEVKEAPPGTRGNTAQGGTKQVVIETGASVNVPLFVEQGDLITINTQTGEYVGRAQKRA